MVKCVWVLYGYCVWVLCSEWVLVGGVRGDNRENCRSIMWPARKQGATRPKQGGGLGNNKDFTDDEKMEKKTDQTLIAVFLARSLPVNRLDVRHQ